MRAFIPVKCTEEAICLFQWKHWLDWVDWCQGGRHIYLVGWFWRSVCTFICHVMKMPHVWTWHSSSETFCLVIVWLQSGCCRVHVQFILWCQWVKPRPDILVWVSLQKCLLFVATFRKWKVSEPTKKLYENCVAMQVDGSWTDEWCSQNDRKWQYVCERGLKRPSVWKDCWCIHWFARSHVLFCKIMKSEFLHLLVLLICSMSRKLWT